jgi:hypothetical protein
MLPTFRAAGSRSRKVECEGQRGEPSSGVCYVTSNGPGANDTPSRMRAVGVAQGISAYSSGNERGGRADETQPATPPPPPNHHHIHHFTHNAHHKCNCNVSTQDTDRHLAFSVQSSPSKQRTSTAVERMTKPYSLHI